MLTYAGGGEIQEQLEFFRSLAQEAAQHRLERRYLAIGRRAMEQRISEAEEIALQAVHLAARKAYENDKTVQPQIPSRALIDIGFSLAEIERNDRRYEEIDIWTDIPAKTPGLSTRESKLKPFIDLGVQLKGATIKIERIRKPSVPAQYEPFVRQYFDTTTGVEGRIREAYFDPRPEHGGFLRVGGLFSMIGGAGLMHLVDCEGWTVEGEITD